MAMCARVDDTVVELKPCPFCGAGETRVQINHYPGVLMNRPKRGVVSVEITHWCPAVEGQPNRNTITRVGRDMESAVAAWDQRTATPVPACWAVERDEVK